MTESIFAKRVSGGDFFKPKDHIDDLAIVLEPKRVLFDQPHEYEGVKSTRDVAVADIACFRNSSDVEAGVPSLIMQGVQITNEILVKDIDRNDWLNKVALVTIDKAKRAYVYRDVAFPGAEEAAQKWFVARAAEVEANLSDVPSFD